MTLWGRRFENDDEEVPPELRGKSPKEVAAALKKASELETQSATDKQAAADAVAARVAQQNEFDQMKQKITELEARGGPTKTAEELEAERLALEPPSPWTDPEKFVQNQTRGVAGVALNAGLMAAKMYFMQNLTSRDSKIFKKYEKEVEGVVATFAPEARVMPQSWMNGFLYIKGMHETDISKAESTSTDFFSETPSRGHQDEPEPQDKLTEEETAMCKSMHWDEAGYLKRKKEMQVSQSSKGAYARFSSTT